jgi:hypothetical protein
LSSSQACHDSAVTRRHRGVMGIFRDGRKHQGCISDPAIESTAQG